jgi:hypothetical protein
MSSRGRCVTQPRSMHRTPSNPPFLSVLSVLSDAVETSGRTTSSTGSITLSTRNVAWPEGDFDGLPDRMGEHAAIDVEGGAGNPTSGIGQQEQACIRNILRLTQTTERRLGLPTLDTLGP